MNLSQREIIFTFDRLWKEAERAYAKNRISFDIFSETMRHLDSAYEFLHDAAEYHPIKEKTRA